MAFLIGIERLEFDENSAIYQYQDEPATGIGTFRILPHEGRYEILELADRDPDEIYVMRAIGKVHRIWRETGEFPALAIYAA